MNHTNLFRHSAEQRSQSTRNLFEENVNFLNRTIHEFHSQTNFENISFTFGNQHSPPSSLKLGNFQVDSSIEYRNPEKKPSNTLPTLFSTQMNTIRSTTTRPKMNLFSTTTIIKPSILSSIKSTKRKFDDSNEDESLFSTNKFSKLNLKRPRMLDMNKIRSIILGSNSSDYSRNEHRLAKQTSHAFSLPKLTHHDYYTEPKIDELKEFFNDYGQCLVKEFTIGRKHYGSITFRGRNMNLAGLDLDRIVEIDRRQVTIYPNEHDRPCEGEELNCQAIISLIGVYPIDRSKSHHGEEITDPQRLIEMNYGKYLEQMTKKFQGNFLDYDVQTGTWKFQVEHF